MVSSAADRRKLECLWRCLTRKWARSAHRRLERLDASLGCRRKDHGGPTPHIRLLSWQTAQDNYATGRPIRRHGYEDFCRADRSKKKHRRGQAVACLHWYSKPANLMSGLRLRAVMPTTVDGGSTRRDRPGMLAPRERAGMRRMRSAPMPIGLRGCWETGPSWLSSDRLVYDSLLVVAIACQYRSLTRDQLLDVPVFRLQ